MAEAKLIQNVKGGNQRAIEFYLTHMHKDRGYKKKFGFSGEIDTGGKTDKPMKIKVRYVGDIDGD